MLNMHIFALLIHIINKMILLILYSSFFSLTIASGNKNANKRYFSLLKTRLAPIEYIEYKYIDINIEREKEENKGREI